MSDKVKVWIDKSAVREAILQSNEMNDILKEYAENIKEKAGEGYECEVRNGKNRSYAVIYADTYAAKRDNVNNNTLLTALGV